MAKRSFLDRFKSIGVSTVFTLSMLICVDVSYGDNAAGFSFASQINPLIPTGAQVTSVEPGSELSLAIDSLVLAIFNTKVGKTFCSTTESDYESFRLTHFINEQYAQQAFPICHGYFSPNKKEHKIHPKKYYWVNLETQTGAPAGIWADAWTNPLNETFLFFSKDTLASLDLLMMLTHEFAISFDAKEQIGFRGVIDFPNIGLKEDPMICNLIPLIRHPRMKHALSALRAFDIEAKMLTELNIPLSPYLQETQKMSCSKKISSMLKMTQFISKNSIEEAHQQKLFDIPACITSREDRSLSTPQILDIFEHWELSFHDNTTESACSFFTTSNRYFIGVSFLGGPRPRVGGGWDQEIQERPAIEPHFRDAINHLKNLKTNEKPQLLIPSSNDNFKSKYFFRGNKNEPKNNIDR